MLVAGFVVGVVTTNYQFKNTSITHIAVQQSDQELVLQSDLALCKAYSEDLVIQVSRQINQLDSIVSDYRAQMIAHKLNPLPDRIEDLENSRKDSYDLINKINALFYRALVATNGIVQVPS